MGGGKGPETPPPRDYYTDTMGNLRAQVQMAPSVFAAEAAFTPKMQRLTLGGYRNTLLGRVSYEELSDASKQEYNVALAEQKRAAELLEANKEGPLRLREVLLGENTRNVLTGGFDRRYKAILAEGGSIPQEEWDRLKLVASTPPDPAAFSDRGLMEILEKDIMPSMSRSDIYTQRQQREADIKAVEDLGLRASEAYLSADPRSKGLLEELNRQALENLKSAGAGTLTASQQRLAVQTARGAASARGVALGSQGSISEILNTYKMAEDRRAAAMTNASAVMGLNKANIADPFQAVLGRQSGAFTAGIGQQQFASGFASNIGPRTFSPESQYAADLAAGNQQTAASYAAARAQVSSGITSAIGGVLGGFATGGGSFLAKKAMEG
jgi:hypothetical protein